MLKQRLAAGETVVGTWLRIPHPTVIEVLAKSGLDFIHVDMEHGPIGIESMDRLLLAAKGSRIPAVVRVPGLDATGIGSALDLGAAGVIVPRINRIEETVQAVRAARYYPCGERGVAGDCRANGYGTEDFAAYAAESNRNTLLALQIESKEAVEQLDGMLEAGDAVDLFFIGPADLSQSLGIPCRFDHPLLLDTIRQIAGKVRSTGKAVGIHAPTAELAREFFGMGVQYVTVSFDIGFLSTGAKEWMKKLNG
ncbi:4-hydroxy-2-oxovalerate aldolase [Marinithermofilum abyssi]|uniref:4-hydroxy-2-oxovalerate aldolase n=1 Tax=Marinithermofilum abyssi TaxID=1571185 RepID=A0A8J2VJA5_9BACL|nr:aldolase/citrate lyase family protein [Marinithermofilum abyssi]GGE24467.1 4-hydroxy-2-oxovalerate aldolase [Marinithermofilum abyssi]